FLTRAKEKYFNEGGERVIDIEEIVVVAKKRQSPFFATGNTGSRLHGDLSGYSSIYDALATFKELNVIGQNVTTTREYVTQGLLDPETIILFETEDAEAGEENDVSFIQTISSMDDDMLTPDVYINDRPSSIEDLGNYDMKYVERLAFVDGKAAYMLGLSAPAGAILIEVSKEGLNNTGTSSEAMARVVLKGCQKPDQFYKPKYPTIVDRLAEKKDMRSTITWEPLIHTDASGQATIAFYTADRSGMYDVILEGITDDGELCRSTKKIAVEVAPLK
ncbi:MAG: hypothetical protein KBS95_04955, partial [Alistipes sp.]|nr:hypothetical protein [Candidatus Alistipes equi]